MILKFRSWVLLVLVGALATLSPLADACPPDATWIAGVYNEADFDDVVALITARADIVEPSPPHQMPSVPLASEVLQPADQGSAPNETSRFTRGRAPPGA